MKITEYDMMNSLVRFLLKSSRRGRRAFLSIYLLHLLSYAFDSMDFGLLCNLIQPTLALYEVRVPQTRDLPLASFRFHLAVDTLALS
ncbi:hypothetical protein [Paenibacillus sp. FSL K6-2859]|uniref:hypothetical protein n=1 Tax=Paenibacillus sp. FSL K6-2859 TaxID=2921482 RepID=UPI0030F551A1